MKETGVVRKLDNLGRLVIPKEIRRCMRIKEGSSIEFGLLPSGEIVLCKYSLMAQVSDYAVDICEALADICDMSILIADREKVLAVSGINKKSAIGAKLSIEILDIMDSKNSYTASLDNGTTIVKLYEDDKNTYCSQIIVPILIQGEVEGIIAICSSKAEIKVGSEHLLMLKFISKFLSKQME